MKNKNVSVIKSREFYYLSNLFSKKLWPTIGILVSLQLHRY
jgi:hypothetical protein